MKNYYEILNLNRNATTEEIREAYRKLAFKYHPDRNKESDTNERFLEISEAYEILKDSEKRKNYNKYFYNNDFSLKENIEKQKRDAENKAKEYSHMSYEKFEFNIQEEMKVLFNYVPNFGCLFFLIIGFFVSVYFFIKISSENPDLTFVGLINILVYGGIAIWLYNKFGKSYKKDRENIYKK